MGASRSFVLSVFLLCFHASSMKSKRTLSSTHCFFFTIFGVPQSSTTDTFVYRCGSCPCVEQTMWRTRTEDVRYVLTSRSPAKKNAFEATNAMIASGFRECGRLFPTSSEPVAKLTSCFKKCEFVNENTFSTSGLGSQSFELGFDKHWDRDVTMTLFSPPRIGFHDRVYEKEVRTEKQSCLKDEVMSHFRIVYPGLVTISATIGLSPHFRIRIRLHISLTLPFFKNPCILTTDMRHAFISFKNEREPSAGAAIQGFPERISGRVRRSFTARMLTLSCPKRSYKRINVPKSFTLMVRIDGETRHDQYNAAYGVTNAWGV